MTLPIVQVTPRATERARWALASLSLSMLMPSLDTSIANVALPTLARAFGASFQEVQWVVLAYLLAVTTLIVGAGRLGDLLGRRRVLLFGIATFTSASVLCGVAPSLPLLIAARAAQGLGAATMLPLTIALVGETVPKERTGSAMGLLGTMSAIGTTLGPSIGGVLIDASGWRAIFLINVPLGILNGVLALWSLAADPPSSATGRARLDVPGTGVLGVALAAYALAVTTGHGTFRALNGVLLGVAAGSLLLFVLVERRAASPLLQLALLRERAMGTGLALSAAVSTVLMATLVVGPFYLSRELGLGPARVGLVMSVGPLVAALTGLPAGRIVDRLGSRRMTTFGLAGITVGLLALSTAPGRFGVAGYLAAIVVVTAHYAVFQAANNTTVMAEVVPARRGVISGMLSLSRNLGLISGAAVMGALFVAVGMQLTFAIAAMLMLGALVLAVGSRSPRRATSSGRLGTEPLR